MFSTPIIVKVGVVALALSASLAACGDDDTTTTAAVADTAAAADPTAAATETSVAVPADVAALIEHFDTVCTGEPGFDQFMTEHPEPTAQDWAEFLPQQHQMLSGIVACIADSDVPARLTEEIDVVIETMNVVVADLAAAAAAAEAGDLEKVNAVLGEMNPGHTDAMQQAQDAFGEAALGE